MAGKKIDPIEEKNRLIKMYTHEKQYYTSGIEYIAGVDEAGRGPLAGPVVAAAVILPKDLLIEGVDDSKKLTESRREALFYDITQKCISYGVGIIDEKYIDKHNILNATKAAMLEAISKLSVNPQVVLIDAVELSELNNHGIQYNPIVKGDQKSIAIAAASIIAKVTRDKLMYEYDKEYPCYNFKKHKGYGTKEHILAIKKYGICPIHRLSFTKKFI